MIPRLCKYRMARLSLVIIVLLVTICAVAVAPAMATTYYVKPDGDNSLDGKSLDTAWKDIDNGDVTKVLVAGDTVLVEPGTYSKNPTNDSKQGFNFQYCSGTTSAPITYKADGTVVIDQQSNGHSNAGFFVAVSNVVIDGFTLTGMAWGIYGQTAASAAQKYTNVVIQNCYLHDMKPRTSGSICSCLFVDGLCANWTIRNNIFANNNGYGATYGAITAKWSHSIYNNTFYDCNVGLSVISGANAASTVFENNIVDYMHVTSGSSAGGYGINNAVTANVVTPDYNLYYDCISNYSAGGVTAGSHEVTDDPLFLSTASGDSNYLRLSTDPVSPAVDAGVFVWLAYGGAAPDIGAFETGEITNIPGYVTGTVTDTESGTPLPHVKVASVSIGNYADTDVNGQYTLAVMSGQQALRATSSYTVTQDQIATAVGGETVTQDFVLDLRTPDGTVYHVKTDGDDTKDGLTLDTAWASIDNGDLTGVLQPGDTVLVEPGTYRYLRTSYIGKLGYQLANRNGVRAGDTFIPITYKADGTGVEITGGNTSADNCGLMVGTNGLLIDGFSITGAAWGIYGYVTGGNVVVQNCTFHDMAPRTSGNLCAGLYLASTSNWTIRNNLFTGINGDDMGAVSTFGNSGVQIYNNTFVNCHSAWQGWSTTENSTFQNNIAVGMTHAAVYNPQAPTWYVDHNLYWNNAANYDGYVVGGVGENTADPLFSSSGDYSLTSESPAIDAGVYLGLPFNGLRPDQGAFEAAGAASGTVSGTVTNAATGDPLMGVTITCVSSGASVATDADGQYTLDVPSGSQVLRATSTYTTAQDQTVTVLPEDTVTLDFQLTSIASAMSMADIKKAADGATVATDEVVVTTVFDTSFYVELPDRTAGIRVDNPVTTVSAGQQMRVGGLIQTDPITGERYIDCQSIMPIGSGSVAPLGLINLALGGSAFGLQDGVTGGVGMNNIGLLTRTTGKVSSVSHDDKTFYLDDGSGVQLKVALPSFGDFDLTPEADTYVCVTGISSCERDGDNANRLLKATGRAFVPAAAWYAGDEFDGDSRTTLGYTQDPNHWPWISSTGGAVISGGLVNCTTMSGSAVARVDAFIDEFKPADFTLHTSFRINNYYDTNAQAWVLWRESSINAFDGYCLKIIPTRSSTGTPGYSLRRGSDGTFANATIEGGDGDLPEDTDWSAFHTVDVVVVGNSLSIWFDGNAIFTGFEDPSPVLTAGYVGFGELNPSNVDFDYFHVTTP